MEFRKRSLVRYNEDEFDMEAQHWLLAKERPSPWRVLWREFVNLIHHTFCCSERETIHDN